MTTKAKAEARAAELGCTLVDDGDSISVDAPAGRVLGGVGQHYTEWGYGRHALTKRSAWQAIYDDMGTETYACPDARCHGGPGCEVCDESPVQEGVGA